MSRSSKELKVKLQNDINVYLHHALPLCAILAEEAFYPWYYQHYMQLMSDTEQDVFRGREWRYIWVDFLEGEGSYRQVMDDVYIPHKVMRDNRDIIGFIKEYINQENYLIINVNEYYLPNKSAYRKRNFLHPSLIYGYNDDEKKVATVSFNANRIFSKMAFDYDDFSLAYQESTPEIDPWLDTQPSIRLIKLKELREPYPFQAANILSGLGNYIHSHYDSCLSGGYYVVREDGIGKRFQFGFAVYDVIEEYLKKLYEGEDLISYHAIHLLFEHKKALHARIDFLISKYNLEGNITRLAASYQKIVVVFDGIRWKFLKYQASKRKNLLQDIIKDIQSSKKEELALLIDIHNDLQVQFKGCLE